MKRRTFLGVIAGGVIAGGVLAAPLAAGAQQHRGKVPRIGVLSGGPRVEEIVKALEDGMAARGYVEGRNVVYERRFATANTDLLLNSAAEMVRLKVDVIVAMNTPAVVAAQRATGTIPIVMVFPVDPVGSGLVASLARPGGNTTGLSLQLADVAAKRVQLFKEVVPAVPRISLLWDPTFPGMEGAVAGTEAAASRLGLKLQILEARSPSELDRAFETMTTEGVPALIVWGSDTLFVHRAQIARLATKARLPAICPFREYVDTGCLMSYSASLSDLCRRAATYVDRILKGARPADLPVEQPEKFELAINLKTAKALGLTIPQSLLLRADQVIE